MEENKINVLENQPLVSIIVITYNSAKYVLETLESARAQTYQNIELIVSDDCSTDNTVEICRQWVEENKARFVRTEIITPPHNTGIPANCNRGVKAARGEWVKLIAGDDVLFNNCIAVFLSKINKSTKIIASELKDFEDSAAPNLAQTINGSCVNKRFIKLETAQQQFIYFLKGFYITTPALFFNHSLINKNKPFHEKFNFVEDIPFFLDITSKGVKIDYIPNILVGRRKHPQSVTALKRNTLIPSYLTQVYEAILYFAKLNKKTFFVINAHWHLFMFKCILRFGNRGPFAVFINKFRMKFQPIRLLNLIEKLSIYVFAF